MTKISNNNVNMLGDNSLGVYLSYNLNTLVHATISYNNITINKGINMNSYNFMSPFLELGSQGRVGGIVVDTSITPYPISTQGNSFVELDYNSISTTGQLTQGIAVSGSDNTIIKNNNITAKGEKSSAVGIYNSNNISMNDNTILASSMYSLGLLLLGSKDLTVYNGNINNTIGGNSVIIGLLDEQYYGYTPSSVTFTNVTFDDTTLNVSGASSLITPLSVSEPLPPSPEDSGGFLSDYIPTGGATTDTNVGATDYEFEPMEKSTLTTKWYADITIKEGDVPVSNAQVTITDLNNTQIIVQTDSQGILPIQTLTEFIQNGSQRIYYTPHTLTITKEDTIQNLMINMTERKSSQYVATFTPESTPPTPETPVGIALYKEVYNTFTEEDITIQINPTITIMNATVQLKKYSNNTKNSVPSENVSFIKSVEITLDDETNNNIATAYINMTYTYEEIWKVDVIDGSSLRLYAWDETTQQWNIVPNTKVNTTNKMVWANITSSGTYGLFGTVAQKSEPNTGESGNSGGSSGEGGSGTGGQASGSGGGSSGTGGQTSGGGGMGGGSSGAGSQVTAKKNTTKTNNTNTNMTDTGLWTLNTKNESTTPIEEQNTTQPLQETPAQAPEQKTSFKIPIIAITTIIILFGLFFLWTKMKTL